MDDFNFLDEGNFDLNVVDFQETFSLEELPSKIEGTYTEDYNILYIDSIIKKKLQRESTIDIKVLKSDLQKLVAKLKRPLTHVTRESTIDSIKSLTENIQAIETGQKYREYIDLSTPVINLYKSYKSGIKKITFNSSEPENDVNLSNNDLKHRLSIIEQYFSIAEKYISLNIIHKIDIEENVCKGCSTSLVDVVINDNGTQICPNCCTEHDVIILSKTSKDSARINTLSTNDDDSIENFLKAFDRYQCIQNDIPPETLYQELDNYFIKHGKPIGKDVRKLPMDSRGRRGNTNHSMLYTALLKIGYSDYYEDANFIGNKYWGWKIPNVQHLRSNIIDKYHKTQKALYKIPVEERGRISSLGTQYRLWRHLQLEGHVCFMDEFKIAENPDSLRTHDKLWKKMCENSGDPDIKYID